MGTKDATMMVMKVAAIDHGANLNCSIIPRPVAKFDPAAAAIPSIANLHWQHSCVRRLKWIIGGTPLQLCQIPSPIKGVYHCPPVAGVYPQKVLPLQAH